MENFYIWISGAKNSTDISDALSSICADLKWDAIPTIPLKATKNELTQAQRDLQDCRTHVVENRQKFLSKLIEAAALQDDISREKVLKRQLHVEAIILCYKKLRSALRPNGLCGGITKVEVKVNKALVAYTKKEDVSILVPSARATF
jgi:hypothetical protein